MGPIILFTQSTKGSDLRRIIHFIQHFNERFFMSALKELKLRIQELEEALREIQDILDGLFDSDSENEEESE